MMTMVIVNLKKVFFNNNCNNNQKDVKPFELQSKQSNF